MDSPSSLDLPPGAQAVRLGSLNNTVGALLIGSFFSAVLYGLCIHQCYCYMRLFPTDSSYLRLLVVVVLILETLQVICSMHVSYDFLVTNYFNPLFLTKATWSANMITVAGALIISTAELFFIRRVSLIGMKYKLLSVLASLLLMVKLVGDLDTGIEVLAGKGFCSGSLTTYTDDKMRVLLPLAAINSVNILLSGSLFFALKDARADYNGSDSWTSLFILYVVNTGVLVLLFDMLAFILAIVIPEAFYWVSMHLIAARVYMNTLLCVLNSRKLIVSRGMEIFDAGSFGANIIARANRLATAEQFNVPQVPSDEPPTMIDIKVTTEVEGSKVDEAFKRTTGRRPKDRRVSLKASV